VVGVVMFEVMVLLSTIFFCDISFRMSWRQKFREAYTRRCLWKVELWWDCAAQNSFGVEFLILGEFRTRNKTLCCCVGIRLRLGGGMELVLSTLRAMESCMRLAARDKHFAYACELLNDAERCRRILRNSRCVVQEIACMSYTGT